MAKTNVIDSFHKDYWPIDVILDQIRAYRAGTCQETPHFVAPTHLARSPVDFKDITFTFSDRLLDDILSNDYHPQKDFKKDLRCALTYGFRGFSNGGINGIVRLRPKSDARMHHRVAHYLAEYPAESREKYEGVKIVSHNPPGFRTIGVHDTDKNHVLFFDRMNYRA